MKTSEARKRTESEGKHRGSRKVCLKRCHLSRDVNTMEKQAEGIAGERSFRQKKQLFY